MNTYQVSGVVRDPDGAPVSEAVVRLLGSRGETITAIVTDAGGRYLFEDLPMGEYTLAAIVRSETTDILRVPRTASLDPVITAPRTGPAADQPNDPVGQTAPTMRRRRALPAAILGAAAVTAAGLLLGVSLVDRGGDSDSADSGVPVPKSETVIGAEPSGTQVPAPTAEPMVIAPLPPAVTAVTAERSRVSAATPRATPSAPRTITLAPTSTPVPPPPATPGPLPDPSPQPERPGLLGTVAGLLGGLLS